MKVSFPAAAAGSLSTADTNRSSMSARPAGWSRRRCRRNPAARANPATGERHRPQTHERDRPPAGRACARRQRVASTCARLAADVTASTAFAGEYASSGLAADRKRATCLGASAPRDGSARLRRDRRWRSESPRPRSPERIENPPEIAPRNRIDAVGRLVEQKHFGRVDQRADQAELLLHSAR